MFDTNTSNATAPCQTRGTAETRFQWQRAEDRSQHMLATWFPIAWQEAMDTRKSHAASHFGVLFRLLLAEDEGLTLSEIQDITAYHQMAKASQKERIGARIQRAIETGLRNRHWTMTQRLEKNRVR